MIFIVALKIAKALKTHALMMNGFMSAIADQKPQNEWPIALDYGGPPHQSNVYRNNKFHGVSIRSVRHRKLKLSDRLINDRRVLTDSQPKLIALNRERSNRSTCGYEREKKKKIWFETNGWLAFKYLHYGIASYGATHVVLMSRRMIVIIRVLIAFKFNAVFCIHLHFIAHFFFCSFVLGTRRSRYSWAVIIDRNVIAVAIFFFCSVAVAFYYASIGIVKRIYLAWPPMPAHTWSNDRNKFKSLRRRWSWWAAIHSDACVL